MSELFHPPDPTAFNALVWRIVRQVPPGKVTTYGQLASMIPPPAGVDPLRYVHVRARWTGAAMRALTDDSVPWHRVINSQGKISLPRGGGYEEQRARLEAEGVTFDERGRVNFKVVGWAGPDDAWLAAHGLLPPQLLG